METRPPRAMLITLGCAKNSVDSEHVLGELAEAGFDLCIEPEEADIILINTCGFISDARAEAREVIGEMLCCKGDEDFPKIVAMGCLAQRDGAALRREFPAIDGVFGLAAYGNIAKLCMSVLDGKKRVEGMSRKRSIPEGARLLSTPPSYAYLRISDGCNNRCSYCAIPLIRGNLHSREMQTIIDEAIALADSGIKELILVAQDTTLYGKDLYGQPQIEKLIEEILAHTTLKRLRIMYAHPAHLGEGLLKLLGSESRLCGYLDLPLQHINDRILKEMKRRYNCSQIYNILEKVNKYCPDLVMRTSLITGFPGENKEEFSQMLDFVKEGHFCHLGVFPYSAEKGTAAYKLKNQVTSAESTSRMEEIMLAQQQITFKWLDSRIGDKTEVIIDTIDASGNYICRSCCEAPEVDGNIYVNFTDKDSGKNGKKFLPGDHFITCLQARNGYDIEADVVY